MKMAIWAVKDGQCKMKEAAREYDVPRTTLQDGRSERIVHGIKPGSKKVMGIVEATAQEKGLLRKNKINQGWFHRFIECQLRLALRKGDHTAFVCMDAMRIWTIISLP